MKIYLDDERPTPEGWEGVNTASECIRRLSMGGVEAISLDHDLGPESAGTGYQVACWIEKEVATNPNYFPPVIYVHSANPAGVENIWRCRNAIWNLLLKKLNKWEIS